MTELGLNNYGTDSLETQRNNQPTTKITENLMFHHWTKHIKLKYLFTKNETEKGQFKVPLLCIKDMITNALTKLVPSTKNAICAKGFSFKDFC